MRHLTRLLPVLAILLAANAARATPARVVGLGDLGRYVEDDTNVLDYPGLLGIGHSAMLKSYTHMVYIDLGGPGGVSPTLADTQSQGLNGGAFLRLTDGISLGLLTSDFVPTQEAAFLTQVAAEADPANVAGFTALVPTSPLRQYDLVLGYSTSDYFGAGLRLSYGSTGQTYTPDSQNDKTSDGKTWLPDSKSEHQFALTLGASGLLDGGSAYDLGISYSFFGLDYEKSANPTFAGGGANELTIQGRYRMVLSQYWDLIPQITYKGDFFGELDEHYTVPGFGPDDPSASVVLPNSGDRLHDRLSNSVDVGAAAALRASKMATFWVATGLQYTGIHSSVDMLYKNGGQDEVDTVDASLYSLPYLKFAFEAAPTDWLRLRAAVEKYSWSGSMTTENNNRAQGGKDVIRSFSAACGADSSTACALGAAAPANVADFNAYVGASVVYNGFFLDLLLDNQFFNRGLFVISGAGGNVALRATLGAKF